MKNAPLRDALHDRGLTDEKLAALIQSSRAQVTLTLNNTPGRGHLTRKKLAPHLTERERALLGWSATGDLLPAVDTPTRFGVLRWIRNLFHGECSTQEPGQTS